MCLIKQVFFGNSDGNAGTASTYWKVGCFDASTQNFTFINTYGVVNQTLFAIECGALYNY
jgi:hypothetical protein